MSGSESLRDLQRWFLSAVTEGVSDGIEHVSGTVAFPAEAGLAVYEHAYLARLIECLQESFPAVARIVGPEAFGALAADYLRACPPSGFGLGTLGAGFVAHLEATRPPEAGPAEACLVALAHYERALDEVFDGAGAEGGEGLVASALSGLSPEVWLSTCLVPNPALRLCRYAFPVDDLWSQVRALPEAGVLPPLPAAGVQCVALSRRDYVVRRLVLDEPEYALLSALSGGVVIGEALSSLSSEVSAGALEGWFTRWMMEGLFVALERC